MIERVCLQNGYYYIENGNGCENDLFKDELDLQNSGKKILSKNFIVNLQTYGTFLEKRTWSPNIGRWETLVQLVQLVSQIYKCYMIEDLGIQKICCVDI